MAKKSSWSERVAEREGVKHDARIENIFQTKQTHQAKNGRTRVKLKVKQEQKKGEKKRRAEEREEQQQQQQLGNAYVSRLLCAAEHVKVVSFDRWGRSPASHTVCLTSL